MRHVDEYRDPAAVDAVVRRIRETVTRPWTLMEVCGGQTHSILKFGLDELLPGHVRFVHGPGCPVCVTPLEMIDRAVAIAALLAAQLAARWAKSPSASGTGATEVTEFSIGVEGLRGMDLSPDGRRHVISTLAGPASSAAALGVTAAEDILSRGGRDARAHPDR